MKIVFVSNYFNHHQRYLCDELYKRCESFWFISTTLMREERRIMGYDIKEQDYVVKAYQKENFQIAKDLIKDSDILIVGSARGEFSSPKLYRGKIVFYYSERVFRKPVAVWKIPLKAIKYNFRFMYRQNSYLLCSGAYTAADFAKTHTFHDHCLKWGYFPENKHYDISGLIKKKDKKKILWCGRLLDWKHPELAVEVAHKLKTDGVDFSLDIIGDGAEKVRLHDLVNKYGLTDCVNFLGALKQETVRAYMEKSGIFLFTSDKQEGWGAVLNEAMNSGCAVVASHMIGSVPFLVSDEKNGLVFKSGDLDDLYQKVKHLLDTPDLQVSLGSAAYDTINSLWNAEVAAERFIALYRSALAKQNLNDLYKDGPCSRAELISEYWINGEK